MRQVQFFLRGFFFFVFFISFGNAKEALPLSMGALGDSISAAALAAFKRTDIRNPLAFPKFMYFIGRYGYYRSVQAFESRELSWSTGSSEDIFSHAQRIEELSGKKIKVFNGAISGAGTWSLNEEVTNLLIWSKKNLRENAPDYVTLEIGANDACIDKGDTESTSVAEYSSQVQSTVNKLIKENPKIKILISGIPNVPKVKRTVENSRLGLLLFPHCKDIWKKLPYCQNILQNDDQDSLDRSEKLISSYMHELENIVLNTNDKEGRAALKFAPEVFSYPITENDISFDCFHPNKKGQALLSDITWKYSWWK